MKFVNNIQKNGEKFYKVFCIYFLKNIEKFLILSQKYDKIEKLDVR